jgi:YfiH family protein
MDRNPLKIKPEMNIAIERKTFKGNIVNVYETRQMLLGFTEIRFPLEDLAAMFHLNPAHIIELKQVHSDTIRFSSRIKPGTEREKTRGDGIILDQRERMAVIKTADCTPLFFWNNRFFPAGVIHIGWRGLLKGIEKKWLKLLVKKSPELNLQHLHVFLGPSIEAQCYEVGPDLWEKFSGKTYRSDIFYKSNRTDQKPGLVMDIKKGIHLSLVESGIPADHIFASPLCTFCETDRFPSHRRHPDSGERIYNFIILKNE